MDGSMKGYLLMLFSAIAVSIIVSVAMCFVLDNDAAREYASLGSMVLGAAVGLVALYLYRKRDVFYRPDTNLCIKLREVSTILSFLSVVPTSVAIVMVFAFPSVDPYEFPLISAIMIAVSMIIQAVFWRKAVDVGYMSTMGNYLFCLALILLNISAILEINHGTVIMLALSIVSALAAAFLMHDWGYTADIAAIASLVCAVCAVAVMVIQDQFSIGEMLVFCIPALILIVLRRKLKGTFLVYDGERLF